MEAFLNGLTFGLFAVATGALALYGVHMYLLLVLSGRKMRSNLDRLANIEEAYRHGRRDEDWPIVTTQIPIYNESHVVERVVRAVAAMDYPAGRHEIQVLDDSDDETVELIDRLAERLRASGADVKVVRRDDREGYKAGALAHGLETARGEYVAIFDADFVPPVDFLRRSIAVIDSDPGLACVQSRWEHLNRDECWLTEAQALGIDGHFGVEQGGRLWNGLLINFNGTGGVWRKAAIEDPKVGGWSGDTLTEDLDLSYRAQMAGWRMEYCMTLACPGEVPANVKAFKSQQRRWATGSMQTARKLLPQVWRSKLSLAKKMEATIHMTQYSVALWMIILALTARPILLGAGTAYLINTWFGRFWLIVMLAAAAPSVMYLCAHRRLYGGWDALRIIPQMMVMGCGICMNNTLAALRGLVVRGGEFVRTPKSGSKGKLRRSSSYKAVQDNLWLVELVLGTYSLATFILYVSASQFSASVFQLLYAVGFFAIGWLSRPEPPPSADEPSVSIRPAWHG